MRRFVCGLILIAGMVSLNVALSGCSDSGQNKVLDYDKKTSDDKGAEYKKQMDEALKNRPQ